MARAIRSGWLWGVLGVLAFLVTAEPVRAQQVHRNGFETQKTGWVRGGADADFEEKLHTITDEGAHDGQRCEFLRLDVKQTKGTYIYYQYGIGKGPVTEEFSARLWVKSNRPNIQLIARMILPNERDPNNLEYRMSTILRGDTYRNVGRWQQLELPRPQKLAKETQQRMQAQLNRSVNFTDAYIDSLVLNVYSGPGPTDVWIDDLEAGPVTAAVPATRPANSRPGRNPVVEFNNNQLLVGGKKLFFRGIRHTDTPLRVLREAGFNTLFLDAAAPPSLVKEAVDLGFWLVPQLAGTSPTSKALSPDEVSAAVNRFADNDAVLFWDLGQNLAREQNEAVARTAQAIQQADAGRPTSADILDSTYLYARGVNLLAAHRFPIMTSLELSSYHDWLEQRRRVANPGSFAWTLVQTHAPNWQLQTLFDSAVPATFTEPVGPLAEQVRIMTYVALAAGYRGICYSSDRWLADSNQGRDRLLCCALLNQEIEMLEPLLLMMEEPRPQWIDTSVPDVKAAVLRSSRGVLVLPIWLGRGSQHVPGQAAVAKLSMTVPQVPQTSQAWEVHPADVRSLRIDRVTGGTRITLPEFGLTTAIVFTSDSKIVQLFQDQARNRRQLTAQWSYDMALYELEKMRTVHTQLAEQGVAPAEANHLLPEAENRLRSAKQLWDARNFGESYRESQRALRPVRIVMKAQWDKAVKPLDTVTASPYALSYYTIPRHLKFMEQVGKLIPTGNVLTGGDFEIIPERSQTLWRMEELNNDDVDLAATRVSEIVIQPAKKGGIATTEPAHEGKQCLMLQIKARKTPTPTVLERSRVAVVSPPVKLAPGTLVRVSGWIRIVTPIKGSPDGALFHDSVGGEDLAVRFVGTTPWKKYALYRRVPESGSISVTLALTGLGTVYFDDIRVEPLVPVTPIAAQPGETPR